MHSTYQIKFPDNTQRPVVVDEPTECPICKHAIKPRVLAKEAYKSGDNKICIAATYVCNHCFQPFLGFSQLTGETIDGGYETKKRFLEPNRFIPHVFDPEILALSPSFVEIYNQALAAETAGLDQIAGVGYRKAFEFLIKDFLISRTNDEAEQETIKTMNLGKCISEKCSYDRLKISASRCVWLGNDQTHYVQLFNEYDLQDLKRLITVSVHWISSELLTDDAALIQPRHH